MTLSLYLSKKCAEKLKENVDLFTKMVQEPDQLIKFETSGALKDAALGGMGSLWSLAEKYMTENADALLFAVADATGLEKQMSEALSFFQDALAAAFMIQNNLIFRMTKEIAWTLMEELPKKDEKLIALSEKVKELYAALASLVGAPDYWADYLSTLRQALRLIESTRKDLRLVYNTLSRNDYWLSRKFNGTIDKLEQARDLITPKENNPAVKKISDGSYKVNKAFGTPWPDRAGPQQNEAEAKKRSNQVNKGFQEMGSGLAILGSGLSDNFPLPTTAQGWQATLAIGKLSNDVLIEMQGYFELTTRINLLVDSFKLSLGLLSSSMPAFLKKYTLKMLQKSYARVDTLVYSMANVLNGYKVGTVTTAVERQVLTTKQNEDGLSYLATENQNVTITKASDAALSKAATSVKPGYRPNSLQLTVQSFKWVSDINLILQGYKSIPTKTLDQLALSQDATNKFNSIVARINNMYPGGKLQSSMGRLRMTGGIEELGDLETQLLAFLLEANTAMISSNVRKEILPLGRAVLGRLELSLKADHDLYALMLEWYNYPLPDNEILDELFGGLMRMLEATGLDRALEALRHGDFNTLFSMSGMTCTFVGGALAVIALLKACKLSQQERDTLDKLEAELNSDMDLFNFNFSINFQLDIFKNIFECLRLNGLADLFSLKELLCGIAQDIANGNVDNLSAMYKKMKDAFSFDNTPAV